jgi:hypothetical protein
MQISRRGPGEASLVQDGRELCDIVAADADEAEFEALMTRLAGLFGAPEGRPRILLTYQEGLLGPAQADQPLELLVVEEDPQDEPPLRLLRRQLSGDPAALEAALSQAERRLRLPGRAGA